MDTDRLDVGLLSLGCVAIVQQIFREPRVVDSHIRSSPGCALSSTVAPSGQTKWLCTGIIGPITAPRGEGFAP